MEGGHALLSPSGAAAWVRCPGKPYAEQAYPDQKSLFAEEGTQAHELAARILDPKQPEVTFTPSKEMENYVMEYVEQVADINAGADMAWVEVKVPIDHITHEDDATGTCDYLAVESKDGKTVVRVHDLKYGKGVPVSARQNTQLMLYALGAVRELEYLLDPNDAVVIEMYIHQPRLDVVSEWHCGIEELREWGEWLEDRAAMVTPDAERIPGDIQCRFCRAKHDCDALRELVQATVLEELPSDAKSIAEVLPNLKLIRDWCASVEAKAIEMLENGEPVPGWKLVEGRGSRAWTDPDAVAAKAKKAKLKVDEYMPRSLLSVAQLEKHVGKGAFRETFDGLVVRKPGRPTLAPESDRRPGLTSAESLGFLNTEQDHAA